MSKMGAHVLDKQEADAGAPIAPESQQEFGSDDSTTFVPGPIELLDPAKPIAEYNPIRAAIADLTAKYGKLVFDVSTTKGMDDAKQARMAVRDPRYKIEHIRKALKAPALAYSKRIDDEAKDYTAALLAIETPIDEQIKAREQQVENDRIEKERLAAEARRKIDTTIADIQFNAVYAAGKTSAEIKVILEELGKRPMTEEEFGVRLSEAVLVKNATAMKLCDMHDAAVIQEAEAERLRIANEEAARVRQQQEAEAARLRAAQEDLQRKQQAFAQQQAAANPSSVHIAQNPMLSANAQQESSAATADKDQTAYLLSSPANAAHLDRSIEQLRAGQVQRHAMADIDDSNPFPVVSSKPIAPQAASTAVPRPAQLTMIAIIADHYKVEASIAEQWLRDAFGG